MNDTNHPRSQSKLHETLSGLLAAYDACPDVHHLNRCPLPSRDAVVRMVHDLRELLFPGFGSRQHLERDTVSMHIGDILLRLHDLMSEQVARGLQHDRPKAGCTFEEYRRQGREITDTFLGRLPAVLHLLQTDIIAAFEGDPAANGAVECAFCYPGVEAITIFRLAHELHLLGVPLIPRLMTEYAHSKTGIDIHPGAKIGPSFFIDHGTGVVIGETCEIGTNVKLYQGVTLGALSFPRDETGKIIRGQKRHPTLEDGVVVYANATILGGDTNIGRHAVIGSSVWLTRSVDPYTVVTLRSPELQFRGQAATTRG